jgi:hypothetical protein
MQFSSKPSLTVLVARIADANVTLSASIRVTYLLLLLVPRIVANPISTLLESVQSGLQGSSTCWDGGQCRNPYSCSWKGLIVPCVKIVSTGEIVNALTGLVIGSLTNASTLANDTILLMDPITPNPPSGVIGGLRDLEVSKHSTLANQLKKRHEYVLNCGDNNGPKYKRCSGYPYKYYCKSTGALDNLGDDSPYCDDWCSCQKVYIKYCPLANNKLVQCVGIPISQVSNPTNAIDALHQTTALQNSTPSNENSASISPNREVLEALQSEVDLLVPTLAVGEPAALAKRHNYALDCSTATTAVQKECKEFGYYCTSSGAVQALYGRYSGCDVACECRTVYTNCLVTRWEVICGKGKLVVDAKNEVSGTFVAQIINGTSVLLNNGTVLNNVQWD